MFQFLPELEMETIGDQLEERTELFPLGRRQPLIRQHSLPQLNPFEGEESLANLQELQSGGHARNLPRIVDR